MIDTAQPWFLATALLIGPDGRPTAQSKLFQSTSARDAKIEVTDDLLATVCTQGWAIREIAVTALTGLMITKADAVEKQG